MSTLTLETALAQYNENLDWDSDAGKARLALSALRFLEANRAFRLDHAGSGLTFADLAKRISAIEAFLYSTSATRTSFTSARSRWAR